MIELEYARISNNTREMHITKPTKNGSNSNQYLINFNSLGGGDDKMSMGVVVGTKQPSTLCVIGDWEFEGLLKCLIESAKYIHEGAKEEIKIITCGFDIVSLEIYKNPNILGKYRLKFTFHKQKPICNGASWVNMPDNVFAFYINECELDDFANIALKIEDGIEFIPVLNSITEAWVCNDGILNENAGYLLAGEKVKKEITDHITSIAPDFIITHWCGLIDRAFTNLTSKVKVCKTCQGKFIMGQKAQRYCLGCYTLNNSTAAFEKDLGKINIPGWLYPVGRLKLNHFLKNDEKKSIKTKVLEENEKIKSLKGSFGVLVDDVIAKAQRDELEVERMSTIEYKLNLIKDELAKFKGTDVGYKKIKGLLRRHFGIEVSEVKLSTFCQDNLEFSEFEFHK